jgi:hydroxymethylglutaryl-CoA reductase (NADPH)
MAAATRSIEAVVLGFIVVTLAYFQLLHAVKHSEFLNPASLDGSLLAPELQAASASQEVASLLVRSTDGSHWQRIQPGGSSEPISMHLVRVVVSLDADLGSSTEQVDDRNVLVYPSHPSSAPLGVAEASGSASSQEGKDSAARKDSLQDPEIAASLRDFENYLKTSTFGSTTSHFDPELCQQLGTTTSDECFVASFNPAAQVHDRQARSAILALGLQPSSDAAEWSNHVLASQPVTDSKGYSYVPLSFLHGKREDAGLGLSFKAFPRTSASSSSSSSRSTLSADQEGPRNIKWMLYAGRAFIMRFYALAKKADSADIFVMLIGYLLMHLTFINLFINMRKLGSKFWLGKP